VWDKPNLLWDIYGLVLFIPSIKSTPYSFLWEPYSGYFSWCLDFLGDLGWETYMVSLRHELILWYLRDVLNSMCNH
jgi:hypothetical protein